MTEEWLVPVSHKRDHAKPAAGGSGESAQSEWLRDVVVVERDLASGEIRVDDAENGRWVHTYPTRALLEAASSVDLGEVDAVEWRGAQVRDWVRRQAPDAGVIHHPDSVAEVVVLRAMTHPVQRITVE